MGNSINLRDYKESDVPHIVNLLSAFYDSIKNENDWRHLYLGGPDGKAVISLLEDTVENRIIGYYSAIKMYMIIFGERYLCSKGEAEIYDIEYMKRFLQKDKKNTAFLSIGLVKYTLERALDNGIKMVCTNPSNLALKSHIEAGYEILNHNFSIFVLVRSARYLEHLLVRKIGFRIVIKKIIPPLINFLKTLFFTKTFLCIDKKINLEPLDDFNEKTDSFTREFNGFFSCINIERNQAHLRWRFSGEEYKKFIVRYENTAVGYIVLHIFVNPNGFKEANLVDYIFKPLYWKHFKDVIVKIVKLIDEYKCDFLRLNYVHDYKENFHISRVLKDLFSLRRNDARNIVVFLSPELKSQRSGILDINNWFFTDLFFEGY